MDNYIQSLLASRPDFNAEDFAARRILKHWGLVGKAVKAEMKDHNCETAWELACQKMTLAMRPPNWVLPALQPYALAETDRAAILAHIAGFEDPVVLFVRGTGDAITVFATIKKSCLFTVPSLEPPMMLFPMEGRDDMVIMNQQILTFMTGLYNPAEETE